MLTDRHPRYKALWTPTSTDPNSDWIRFLHDCRAASDGKWRNVQYNTGIRTRELRKMRDRRRIAVSDVVVDRFITYIEPPGWTMADFPWYTATEMEDMGIWRPQEKFNNAIKLRREVPMSLEEHRAHYAAERAAKQEKANARRALKAPRTTPPPIKYYVINTPPPNDDA